MAEQDVGQKLESRETEVHEDGCYVALTKDHLNMQAVVDRVRSPAAGAIVLFAGLVPHSSAYNPWPLTLLHRHYEG